MKTKRKKQDPLVEYIKANRKGSREAELENGSPDKPGGLSIQLCKSEKKEFYIRYSS